MKIQTINNTQFQAKKFRLPVKMVKQTTDFSMSDQYVSKDTLVSGNFVREYSNPKAKKYFDKAMATTDIDKKMYFLEKMGDYKIIDISLEQKRDSFIKAADNMP